MSTIDFLSNGIDLLSNGIDLLTSGIDLLSNGIHFLSNRIDLLSNGIDSRLHGIDWVLRDVSIDQVSTNTYDLSTDHRFPYVCFPKTSPGRSLMGMTAGYVQFVDCFQ